MLAGNTVDLSNGWKLKKVRVSNDDRIELDLNGKFLAWAQVRQLTEAGAFTERIQWVDRYFIPTGKENGGKVLDKILNSFGANAVAVSSDTAFSRRATADRAAPAITREDLNAVVNRLRAAFKGLPAIHIAESHTQAPPELRADIRRNKAEGAAGAWHNGEIYLFRNNIKGPRHAVFTVLHEGTHHGLRRLFGSDLDPLLMSIYLRNEDIRGKVVLMRQKFKDLSVVRAVEEVLADMGGDQVRASIMDRLVAFVRNLLRKFGADLDISDAEIRTVVSRALAHVRKPRKATHYLDGTAYQQDAPSQIHSDAFKRWFGDWEAAARQGRWRAMIDRALDDNQWQKREVLAEGREADPSGKLSDTFGFEVAKQYLTPDDIRKSDKRHGVGRERHEDQVGLTHEDYIKALEVLRDPQTFKRTTSNNGKPSAEFGRRFEDGTLVVAEVETAEDGAVSVKSVWKKVPGRIHAGATPYPNRTSENTAGVENIVHSDTLLVNPASVSKVVDDKGMPLVVYHGTHGDFDAFDMTKALDGAHFFVADESHAASFGVARDFYISMKNPMEISQADLDAAWDEEHPDGEQDDRDLLPRDFVEKFVDLAKASGNDGLIVRQMGDRDIQADMFLPFSPEQIKRATGNNGDFGPANPDIRYSRDYAAEYSPDQIDALKRVGGIIEPRTFQDWFTEHKNRITQNLAQKVADQFAPLRDLDPHAYMLARLSKGHDGALEALLNFGNLRLSDGVTDTDASGQSFIEALQQLQGEQDRFFWWIAANRAEQLSQENRENLFADADIATLKALNQGAMPDGQPRTQVYEVAFQEYTRLSRNVLDIAQQSGIIDGGSRALWEKEFYVPFYRALEDGVSGPAIGRSPGLVRQYAFKKLKGGARKLNQDLLANVMMNWSHLLAAAARNRAAVASLDAAVRAGVAEPVASDKIKNAVYYLKDGREQHFLVDDPAVLDAITSLEYIGIGGPAMKLLSGFKRILTIGVTANPAFKVRNLIRDSLAAIAQNDLDYNVLGNVAQGVGIMRDKRGQTYASLLAGGGLIRFGTMLEGNRAIHLNRLINAGVDVNTIIDTKEKAKDVLQKAWDWYNNIGDISEGANRAALYQQLRDRGMSHLEASYAARDMLDFSMSGTSGAVRFLIQTVPFLNARIQGLYKLGRAGRAGPRRMGAVIGGLALASIALMLAYQDDDDWKRREDWDRDNYWWFKVGGIAYRIPKPFEVGAIATLAERGLELWVSDEMTAERFLDRVKFAVFQTFAFNPVPQMLKPAIDVYSNVDSFTDRPIETIGMERLQKQDRVRGNTGEIARALGVGGQYVGLSPVQIDHLVRGYFGWLGTAANTVVDLLAKPVTDRPARPAWELKDMFLAGNFAETLPARSSRYLTAFYEQSKEIEEAYASYRHRLRVGDIEGAREFREDNIDLLRQHKRVAHAKNMMTRINNRIRQIESSGMDPQAKRDKINQLNQRKLQLAEQVGRYID